MVDIFSKYVMKDEDKSEIFHSSAYGQAQNGASMGAASSASFESRRNQDQARRFVRGYSDSQVANSAFSPVSRPATVSPASPMRTPSAPRPAIQRPPMRQNPGIHR